ncbi:uncharacterized protein [Aegilops tauschii subsp. strangulata]|uniref:uncharacterized protein isoform X5 n=1 Tax=Aegilops tauschii subsp. strangulata TaxID=200361 RepID=UPI003CC8ACF8
MMTGPSHQQVAMSFLGGLGCKENSGIGDWDWDGDGEDADEDEDGDGEDGDGEDEDEDGDGDGEDEDEDEDGDEDGSISGGYDSGDDSECSKEDGDEEHGDTDQDLIKLRIWPAQKHLLLKFFSGKQWKLTKAYRLIWLKRDELEELCKFSLKMDGPIPAPFTTVSVFKNANSSIDFETNVPSGTVDDLLACLKPSINSFHVCKKLGKASDCKKFKCLISGSKCAVKCIPLRASCFEEPREVNIISSLRNGRIMMLFQAWIEPWNHKRLPPQEDYLFLHIELCARWKLFEEIVRCQNTAS